MKIINVGLFAHVDAGKTTMAEHIIYNSGLVNEPGNVDKSTSKFDFNEIEQKRGITVFSEEARIKWNDYRINVIDTPGHIDFSGELYRSLKVVDVAILIVSAVEGIQSHTETIWNILRKENIPTIIFINKIDRTGAETKKINESIKKQFSKETYYPFNYDEGIKKYVSTLDDGKEKDLFNEYIESVVPLSEKLMEKYLDNTIKDNEIKQAEKEFFSRSKIFPIIEGCAIKNRGIKEILNYLTEHYIVKQLSDNNLKAYVYKIKIDEKAGKLTYIKVLSGRIKVRDSIKIKDEEYKVTQIRKYNGCNYYNTQEIESGDIGALTGLKNTLTGDFIGKSKAYSYKSLGILKSGIYPVNEEDRFDLINALKILNEEEPELNFSINNISKELIINITGVIQIEVLEEIIKKRFKIDVNIDTPKINYLETIEKNSKGFCHYEPKKHFGEVEVEIEPLKRGEGIKFSSNLSTDILPSQYQNIIEKSVGEAVKHGILINAPLTDLHIKLIAGKHHLKHTHGGDFRIAFIRAVNKALENNKLILLEPIYKFEIKVPKEYIGKIMTDILKYKGAFSDPITQDNYSTISGKVPVSNFINYPVKIASITKGKAVINMKFLKYEECHNTSDVINDKRNYIEKDEKLYNSISLLRENKKMKKID